MSMSAASNRNSASPVHRPLRRSSRFLVGQDDGGSWIVSDDRHLTGGIFADRATAMHFAMAECDYDPQEVCAAPKGMLSLDTLFDHHRPAPRDRRFG